MTTSAPRSRENTRTRLLDAAAQVFAEVGLEGASVEAVCERAGFTRGAFYSNFESKDQLFLMLVSTVAARRLDRVRARVAELWADGTGSEDCDPAELIAQLLGTGGERLDVMLTCEMRIRALRDRSFGAALIAHDAELVQNIAEIVQDVVTRANLTLRLPAVTTAHMVMIMWEGATTHGVIAGAEAEALREHSGEELGRFFELLFE